ncbi:eL32 family ribosomal protein [archaeon]|nr:eL32 family ribosomal protein [archaeon]
MKFIRRKGGQLKKLEAKWRKPKGLHNKLRLRKAGQGKVPKIGYKKVDSKRGLINGQKYVLVLSFKDLKNIKEKNIVISSNVGLKNKLKIIEECKKLSLNILNIKNVDEFLTKAEEKMKKKKKISKEKEEKKDKRKKETEKKAEEKKEDTKKEEKTSEELKEDKEKKEKEEKRKVLESKKSAGLGA